MLTAEKCLFLQFFPKSKHLCSSAESGGGGVGRLQGFAGEYQPPSRRPNQADNEAAAPYRLAAQKALLQGGWLCACECSAK